MAETSQTLFVPSIEACNEFGIRRKGASSTDQNQFNFLKGPQFKGVNVAKSYEGGSSEGAIDEVKIEFIGNKPVTIRPAKDPNNPKLVRMVIDEKDIKKAPLFTINIAPSTTDWLKFGFNHEWSEGEGIASAVLDTVAALLDGASSAINAAQNLKSKANNGASVAQTKITLDQQDTYQKTDKISFKIPFILFSSGKPNSGESPVDVWVRDIYQPLMVLTAWSHPKRSADILNAGQLVDATTVDANNAGDLVDAETKKNLLENFGKTVNILSSYPGMRVAVSEPPSHVRVSHSSGLFSYQVCAITNFNYAFEGPWVKAYSLLQSGSSGKITEQQKNLLDITLPMVVKGELEIRVIEKMYADDWISMFKNSKILNTDTSNGPLGLAKTARDGIVTVFNSVYN